jgi:anti-anti-sigma factor
MLLDLRGVEFLDSTGLRILLSVRNTALREGYTLTVVPGPARVQRVFDLTGTRGLFAWRD